LKLTKAVLTAALLSVCLVSSQGFAFFDDLAGQLLSGAIDKVSSNIAASATRSLLQGLAGAKPLDKKFSEKNSKVLLSSDFEKMQDPCKGTTIPQGKAEDIRAYFGQMSPTAVSIEAIRFTFGDKGEPLNYWATRLDAESILLALKPKMEGQTIVLSNLGMAFPVHVSACAWTVPAIPTQKGMNKEDWIKISDRELITLVGWLYAPEINIWPVASGAVVPIDASATALAEELYEVHRTSSAFLALMVTTEDPAANAAMRKRDNYWVAPRKMSKMPTVLLGKWLGKRDDGSQLVLNFSEDKFMEFGADHYEVIVNPLGKGKFLVALGEEEEGVLPGTKDCELIDGVFYWGLKSSHKYIEFKRP
jgi:hypothetical protein